MWLQYAQIKRWEFYMYMVSFWTEMIRIRPMMGMGAARKCKDNQIPRTEFTRHVRVKITQRYTPTTGIKLTVVATIRSKIMFSRD